MSPDFQAVGTILTRLVGAGARRVVITALPTGVDFCHHPLGRDRRPVSHWWLPLHKLQELGADASQIDALCGQAAEALGLSPAVMV